jgi:hypothetical protein
MSSADYIRHIERVRESLERRRPGEFEFRIDRPSPQTVEGLIVTRQGVPGYGFVVGVSRWNGGTQGGVFRPGAQHSFSLSFVEQREWETPGLTQMNVGILEGWCSEDPEFFVDKFVYWGFERPWQAPPPVDAWKELQRLQRFIDGRKSRLPQACRDAARQLAMDGRHAEAAERVGLKLNVVTPPDLPATSQEQLDRDVAGLCPGLVAWNFPCDAGGRLSLKTTVLLAQYETPEPPARNRTLCLAAVGPARRKDPQQIRIELVPLIVPNQDHRWENDRWLWHRDGDAAGRDERWRVPDLPMTELTAGPAALPRLEATCRGSQATEGQRAALAILMQDAGRPAEAFALFQIELSEDLKRLLGNQKIYPPACCAHADEEWVALAREILRECAPWLLAGAVRTAAESDPGRRRKIPVLKLAIFPGQHHVRKASLVLTAADRNGNAPSLQIQTTGSDRRLHETAWRRPLEVDLLRYGLSEPQSAE